MVASTGVLDEDAGLDCDYLSMPLENKASSEPRNRRSLTVYVLKKCVIASARDRQKRHAPRFRSGPSLIELGGLVVKAGIVDLTGDDRTTILGALIWIAEKLKGDQRQRARALWAAMGKEAFDMEPAAHKGADHSDPRFLRVAPLSAACIGSAWALQVIVGCSLAYRRGRIRPPQPRRSNVPDGRWPKPSSPPAWCHGRSYVNTI
jgi:hypothetical protein